MLLKSFDVIGGEPALSAVGLGALPPPAVVHLQHRDNLQASAVKRLHHRRYVQGAGQRCRGERGRNSGTPLPHAATAPPVLERRNRISPKKAAA
jgi:hypothetical protein